MVEARFDLLGPLRVSIDGADATPATPKERNLLALLAVNRGPTDPLHPVLDELWPALPPERARPSLHVRVAGVRKALGRAAPGAGSLVASIGRGYRLDVQPDGIDVERFHALVREGQALRGDGDAAGAASA